jgi:hypothetical protein
VYGYLSHGISKSSNAALLETIITGEEAAIAKYD